ncbi:extensin [Iris pallida]|uniref:Extensin n=1 Tax=Iris pallida TaxID=29817 RepID=A0AAX6FTQ6_IRIPA|nr:extensin [Iris pallida]
MPIFIATITIVSSFLCPSQPFHSIHHTVYVILCPPITDTFQNHHRSRVRQQIGHKKITKPKSNHHRRSPSRSGQHLDRATEIGIRSLLLGSPPLRLLRAADLAVAATFPATAGTASLRAAHRSLVSRALAGGAIDSSITLRFPEHQRLHPTCAGVRQPRSSMSAPPPRRVF